MTPHFYAPDRCLYCGAGPELRGQICSRRARREAAYTAAVGGRYDPEAHLRMVVGRLAGAVPGSARVVRTDDAVPGRVTTRLRVERVRFDGLGRETGAEVLLEVEAVGVEAAARVAVEGLLRR